MKPYWIVFFSLISLVLAGCGSLQQPAEETPAEPSFSTAIPDFPTEASATPMNPPSLYPQSLIDKAMQDLAQQLSIATGEIKLVEATEVTWPDGSLGCPQKGMEYAQVLTPGYLIFLEYGGTTFEYHASRDNTVVTCNNPSPPVPGTPANT